MQSRVSRFALAAALLALAASPAQADTLREALASAYNTNPTLEAARANQRGVDENVVIERAAGLPTVAGQASYAEVLDDAYGGSSKLFPDREVSGSLSLTVPVYAPVPLLHPVWVPRNLIMNEAGAVVLQVNPFGSGIRRQQNPHWR